jgi:hypothetical protein
VSSGTVLVDDSKRRQFASLRSSGCVTSLPLRHELMRPQSPYGAQMLAILTPTVARRLLAANVACIGRSAGSGRDRARIHAMDHPLVA